MLLERMTQLYVLTVGVISLLGLIYVYAFPPQSMLKSRDGIPHFTPKVAHPETGEPLDAGELVRHYKGD